MPEAEPRPEAGGRSVRVVQPTTGVQTGSYNCPPLNRSDQESVQIERHSYRSGRVTLRTPDQDDGTVIHCCPSTTRSLRKQRASVSFNASHSVEPEFAKPFIPPRDCSE